MVEIFLGILKGCGDLFVSCICWKVFHGKCVAMKRCRCRRQLGCIFTDKIASVWSLGLSIKCKCTRERPTAIIFADDEMNGAPSICIEHRAASNVIRWTACCFEGRLYLTWPCFFCDLRRQWPGERARHKAVLWERSHFRPLVKDHGLSSGKHRAHVIASFRDWFDIMGDI